MHAFIWANHVESLKDHLEEGKVYSLSILCVKTYTAESIKPIRNNLQIWLTRRTKVTKLANYEMMIRENEFDFFDMGDVQELSIEKDQAQLLDFIGEFDDSNGSHGFNEFVNSNGKEQCNFRFELTDGRSININREKVDVADVTPEHYQILSISEIRKLKLEYIEKEVICQVTIRNVKEEQTWYFDACPTCGQEVEEKDGKYKCQNCNRNLPCLDMRFRLCVIVEDNSGSAAVILDDREVYRIVKKNVYDVIEDQEKEGKKNKFPTIFESLEGKQYTLTISVGENNVKRGSNMYKATDIFEGFELIGNSVTESEDCSAALKNSQVF
ncbi:hypothetical protein AgCh_001213 [Apium graveolens]